MSLNVFETQVAGFEENQSAIRELIVGDSVYVKHVYVSSSDPYKVVVLDSKDRVIGRLPLPAAKRFCAAFDSGVSVESLVVDMVFGQIWLPSIRVNLTADVSECVKDIKTAEHLVDSVFCENKKLSLSGIDLGVVTDEDQDGFWVGDCYWLKRLPVEVTYF